MPGDVGKGGAQHILVVECDRRDDAEIGAYNVGGIQETAHASFDQNDVGAAVDQPAHLLFVRFAQFVEVDVAETGIVDLRGNRRRTIGRADGSGNEVEAVYSNYKEAAGIKLPHSIKVSQGGKPAADITVTEYKLNSGLKPEELGQK